MVTLAIDVVIVAIVVFSVWRGYRNGLIRGAFGVAALIASLFVANIAATAYSEEFTGMLRPFIGGIVDTTLSDMLDQNAQYDPGNNVYENKTPDFKTAYTALKRIGLPEAAAVSLADQASKHSAGEALTDVIADKLSSVLAFVAVFGIAFILLAIVFAVIGNLIGFVFSLPGLRLLDALAGVLFGLAKGLLIVFTIALIVRYFGLLSPSTIDKTTVLSYLVENNPIAGMLGL